MKRNTGEMVMSRDTKLNEVYQQHPWRQHLAIFQPNWIDLILSGQKTIESRFTKVKCLPFGRVNVGDTVYMKESGGLVRGMFTAKAVETYENLTENDVFEIADTYSEQIFASHRFSEYVDTVICDKWYTSKYATLIHIENVSAFEQPFPYHKRDRRAWVVMEKPLVGV